MLSFGRLIVAIDVTVLHRASVPVNRHVTFTWRTSSPTPAECERGKAGAVLRDSSQAPRERCDA
jgi:hypothetical protein